MGRGRPGGTGNRPDGDAGPVGTSQEDVQATHAKKNKETQEKKQTTIRIYFGSIPQTLGLEPIS